MYKIPAIMNSITGDIPLSSFNSTVKFYRSSFSNPLGSMLMNEAFPRFCARNAQEITQDQHKYQQEKMATAWMTGAKRVFMVKDILRRRFAGDATLHRGCYYSVCNDKLGNDHGTLARELTAYMDPCMYGSIIVHDLQMPEDSIMLQKYCTAPAGFAVELLPTVEGSNPIVMQMQQANLLTVSDPLKPYLIYMPLAIEQFEIPQVLDLRQLEEQIWLTKFFPQGNEILTMPAAMPLETFPELLPSLMSAERGGNDFTNSLGFFLRKTGVNGLVFPSARSDVQCEFLHGQLNDFRGWNFVDYRHAKKTFTDRIVDVSHWENDLGEGVTCSLAPEDSPFAHSWRINGLEARMKDNESLSLPDNLDVLTILPD